MEVARLFGLQENKMATDKDVLLLRILTPILKLYTGKQVYPFLVYIYYIKLDNLYWVHISCWE